MSQLKELFEKLKVAQDDDLCEIELDIFALIYDRKEENDAISAFLTLSNWVGFSLRDGVWTFYEYMDVATIERTIQFLDNIEWNELKRMFELGNHDYHNEIYTENYDYPEEWISESTIIDDWIFDNEIEVYKILREILLEKFEEITVVKRSNLDGTI